MMKRYRFHYNGSEQQNYLVQREYYDNFDEDGLLMLTEHEQLTNHNGNMCRTDLDTAEGNGIGKVVEAYFDDGNELNVYVSELKRFKKL